MAGILSQDVKAQWGLLNPGPKNTFRNIVTLMAFYKSEFVTKV